MGIYITNIKMPKTCMKCFCLDPQWARCQIFGKGFSEDEEPMKSRPKWCPLINVQEHGRLIDADSFVTELEKFCKDNWVYNTISHMPTIIPTSEEGE